jgi:hypothetical protein
MSLTSNSALSTLQINLNLMRKASPDVMMMVTEIHVSADELSDGECLDLRSLTGSTATTHFYLIGDRAGLLLL